MTGAATGDIYTLQRSSHASLGASSLTTAIIIRPTSEAPSQDAVGDLTSEKIETPWEAAIVSTSNLEKFPLETSRKIRDENGRAGRPVESPARAKTCHWPIRHAAPR